MRASDLSGSDKSASGAGPQACTTVRPGTAWKWRTLPVATPKPSCRAVAAMSRSSKAMFTPRAAWTPSMRPASLAVSMVTGRTSVADEFIDEGLSPLPAFFRSGTLNAVRQFHDGHNRKADLDFSVTRFELL